MSCYSEIDLKSYTLPVREYHSDAVKKYITEPLNYSFREYDSLWLFH